METRLSFHIRRQPDDSTCGPTCLHGIYSYYGEEVDLDRLAGEIPRLVDGGTLGSLLACHALRRGYRATIYSYNLQLFDPSWFGLRERQIADKLRAQARVKTDLKLRQATDTYLEYIELGGRLRFDDLNPGLIRKYLKRRTPILTGLSATYLYRGVREFGTAGHHSDVEGQPVGHFVVLCGYDSKTRNVTVADPLHPNPVADTHLYDVRIDRVICAILLGVLTYDANLLILQPGVS